MCFSLQRCPPDVISAMVIPPKTRQVDAFLIEAGHIVHEALTIPQSAAGSPPPDFRGIICDHNPEWLAINSGHWTVDCGQWTVHDGMWT